MADISKCFGVGCKRKLDCYRYLAIPNQYQSFSDYDQNPDKCEDFYEADELDRQRWFESIDKDEEAALDAMFEYYLTERQELFDETK